MFRDLNGNEIPYGKTRRTIEENFMLTTSNPNWFEVSGGGSAFVSPPKDGIGYYYLRTNSVLDDEVTLKIFPKGIKLGNVKEIIIEFDSACLFNPSKATFGIHLLDAEGLNGVSLVEDQIMSPVSSSIKAYKSGTPTTKPANFAFGNLQRVNFALRIRDDGTVIIAENDGISFEHKFSVGEIEPKKIIFPMITLKNKTAESFVAFQFSQIRLSIVHN